MKEGDNLEDPPRLPGEFRSARFSQWRGHAQVLDEWRIWCRRALARSHLVTVASHLLQKLRASTDDLEAIGIPVDVLEQFPEWRSGSSAGFQPQHLKLRLPPAGAGHAVGRLRIQLSPSPATVPYALILVRDLLQRMDPEVRFCVVVEPGANLDGLRSLICRFAERGGQRVTFAELRTISVFAQDNARAALGENGEPVLLVPRAFRAGMPRAQDELVREDAQRAFALKTVRSRLYWEGGNIIHDDHACVIGVDTIAENMARLGLSEKEVSQSFEAELGTKVTPLGDMTRAHYSVDAANMAPSGQASFHIDLDVSLLGNFGRNRRPRALVADAAHGLDFVPAVLAQHGLFANQFAERNEAQKLTRAEYEAFACERHPMLLRYAAVLKRLGYQVIGVPDLRIDPAENLFGTSNLDFGYCNVLPGLNRGHPAVHFLPWGVRALDRAAEKRFRKAGVVPVCVSSPPVANALMLLSGGLRCFCGPLV